MDGTVSICGRQLTATVQLYFLPALSSILGSYCKQNISEIKTQRRKAGISFRPSGPSADGQIWNPAAVQERKRTSFHCYAQHRPARKNATRKITTRNRNCNLSWKIQVFCLLSWPLTWICNGTEGTLPSWGYFSPFQSGVQASCRRSPLLTAPKQKHCDVSSPTSEEICENAEDHAAGASTCCSPKRNWDRPGSSLTLLSLELRITGAHGVLRTEPSVPAIRAPSNSKFRPCVRGSSSSCSCRNCSCSSRGDTICCARPLRSADEEPFWRWNSTSVELAREEAPLPDQDDPARARSWGHAGAGLKGSTKPPISLGRFN
jgi:hypothetical protein